MSTNVQNINICVPEMKFATIWKLATNVNKQNVRNLIVRILAKIILASVQKG